MQNLLLARYYSIDENSSERYLVQTQSQVRCGIKLPDLHFIGKGLDPNIQLERQVIRPMPVSKVKVISQIKPRIGQIRAAMRCKIKTQISRSIAQTIQKSPTKIAAPNISKTKDIVIPIADYAFSLVKPKADIGTKVFDRKIINDVSKEISIYPDPGL